MLKIQAFAVAMLLYRFLSLFLVNSSYFSFLPPISTFFNMLCKKMPNKYTINKSARTQTHSTYTSMHKANFLRQLKTAKYFCLSLFPGGFSAGKFGGGRSQRERERERESGSNKRGTHPGGKDSSGFCVLLPEAEMGNSTAFWMWVMWGGQDFSPSVSRGFLPFCPALIPSVCHRTRSVRATYLN